MISLCVADSKVTEWVAERIGFEKDAFGLNYTIAILDNTKLIGGVVYNNYVGHDISMTIATTSPKWANKRIVRNLLAIPFVEFGVMRISALTDAENIKARSMLERLGFVQEGIMRKGSPSGNGDDGYLFSLTSNDFIGKYINGEVY